MAFCSGLMFAHVLLMGLIVHYNCASERQKELIFESYPGQKLTLPQNLTDALQISTLVEDSMECVFKCTSIPWCRSMNLQITSQSIGLYVCELLSTDQFTSNSSMTQDSAYNHYSVKNPCKKMPCGKNGECTFQDNRQDYRCNCKKGFTGEHCEKAPHSCRQIQMIEKQKGVEPSDGIYRINPKGVPSSLVMAYCDMSRDGGGWTLLVTSRTNTWTATNVLLRNAESPSITNDYSVLKYADDIKNHSSVTGSKFKYRLEAKQLGRWGGIWEADRSYTFTATTNHQTNVNLLKRFDNWDYDDRGIEKRMPWISGEKLTTSNETQNQWWGTITGADTTYSKPTPWMYFKSPMPGIIWYWMREGPWQLTRS